VAAHTQGCWVKLNIFGIDDAPRLATPSPAITRAPVVLGVAKICPRPPVPARYVPQNAMIWLLSGQGQCAVTVIGS